MPQFKESRVLMSNERPWSSVGLGVCRFWGVSDFQNVPLWAGGFVLAKQDLRRQELRTFLAVHSMFPKAAPTS